MSTSSARSSLLHVLCPLLCHPNPFDPSGESWLLLPPARAASRHSPALPLHPVFMHEHQQRLRVHTGTARTRLLYTHSIRASAACCVHEGRGCWPCSGRPASLQQRQPHQDDAGEPSVAKASWLALKSLSLSFPWGWDSVGERTPSPRPSGWTPLAVRPGCARLKSPLTKAQFRVAAE